MTNNAFVRDWTPAEDRLLLDLVHNHTITNERQATYPELTWRHVACCMNELSTSRAIIKLRPYEARDVAARYLELQMVMDGSREGERKARDGDEVDQARKMVKKDTKDHEEEERAGKANDSWGAKEAFCLVFVLFQVAVNGTVSQDTEQKLLIGSFTHNGPEGKHEDYSSWKLNFSSEAPHYFASVYGLLQQWPNTFFPNGHAIAPGEIQPFTKLYHGRWGDELPPSPEWLAFDIEMSYGIMGSTPNTHMLTYQTTRTVQVLYFDGESAALQGTGQLDSQMLHVFGNVTGPTHNNRTFGLFDEYARAVGLCDWLFENKLGGIGWGFEGVVRMNAGFELIWCNFSSPSLRLISHLNVTAPQLPPRSSKESFNKAWLDAHGYLATRAEQRPRPLPPSPTRTDKSVDPTKPAMPPGWRRGEADYEPFLQAQGWSWFTSATKHYGSSGLGLRLGESRVKLTSCGILNYYSPEFRSQALARSKYEQEKLNLTSEGLWMGPRENYSDNRTEALKQLTRRRRNHRLNKIDASDAALMKSDTERVLSDIIRGNQRQCSGANWHQITNEIVQVYALDLMRLQLLLKNSDDLPLTNYTAVRDWLFLVRAQNHAFLMPFLQYPRDIKDHTVWAPGSDLAKETISLCQYHHTRLLVPSEGVPLSPEEELLRWAVEEVMGGICYVTQAVGFAVEKTWLSSFNDKAFSRDTEWRWGEEMQAEAVKWTRGVEELMAWLGWAGEWVRCEKACGWDEECYIPMWPLMGLAGRPPKGKRPHDGPPGESPPNDGAPGDGPGWDFPPGYGPPEGPLEGNPPPRMPGFGMDDTDLWEPKCVKASYIVR